jgi:hypothetical protein
MRILRLSPLVAAGLILLVTLNLGLASSVFRLLGNKERAAISKIEWQPARPSPGTMGVPPRLEKSRFQQTLTRPIFMHDRRPYTPPPPPPPRIVKPVAAPPPPKPQPPKDDKPAPPPPITNPGFRLAGIAIVDQTRQAFLTMPGKQEGIWLKEGETMTGWAVTRITSEMVTIEKSGQSFDLLLYENLPGTEVSTGSAPRPVLR